MAWIVTHVDQHQRRRQLLLECASRAAAEAIAEAAYGPAHYLASIRLGRSPR